MFKRILFATDGSPAVERGVLYVGHIARLEQAEVIVVHAYEPPDRYEGYPGYPELVDTYRAVAQALLEDMVQQLGEDGVQVEGELRVGPAAEAIVAAAKDHDIDLIVMGTRGKSNLQDILGSVSAQVLRSAHCPVLEIP
jgi:nucleotide-binding universal stress UspA family protein